MVGDRPSWNKFTWVSSCGLTLFWMSAYVSLCQFMLAYVSLCQPRSVYVSLCQPMSTYVSPCQPHVSLYVLILSDQIVMVTWFWRIFFKIQARQVSKRLDSASISIDISHQYLGRIFRALEGSCQLQSVWRTFAWSMTLFLSISCHDKRKKEEEEEKSKKKRKTSGRLTHIVDSTINLIWRVGIIIKDFKCIA